MKRLAIVSTHPIQYNAPLFRMLAAHPTTTLHVFFTKEESEFRFDAEFGQEVAWDIPLTDGYSHSTYPCQSSAGCRALKQAINSFNPHALLIYGWNPPGHLQCMRHFSGRLPVWFRGDSIIQSGLNGWKRWFRRLALHWIYRHVDRAFFVGKRNQDYFLWAGMTDSQLTLAPHAVDSEFFTRDDVARREQARAIRTEMGICESDTVFLFAGKLNTNKQPIPLAEAFVELREKYIPAAHLVFVGSGPLEEKLKLRFAENTHIHFVGFQNQSRMPIWYRFADILCLVSISETWGLAVNEALLCGCQILIADTAGCIPDLKGPRVQTISNDNHSLWPSAMLNSITSAKSQPKSQKTHNLATTAMAIIDELSRITTNV